MGYFERQQLIELEESLSQNSYGDYLLSLAKESEHDRDQPGCHGRWDLVIQKPISDFLSGIWKQSMFPGGG